MKQNTIETRATSMIRTNKLIAVTLLLGAMLAGIVSTVLLPLYDVLGTVKL